MIPSFDNILQGFISQLNAEYPIVFGYGARILGIMIVLGFGLVAVRAISQGGLIHGLNEFLWGTIKLGLVFAVMENIQGWGHALIETGKQIGAAVGAPVTPDSIYTLITTQSIIIAHARSFGSWIVNPVGDILSEILAGVAVPFIAFGAAMVLFFTLLEATYLITIAPVVVAFSSTEMTFPALLKWAYRLGGLMLKIFTLLMTLTVGSAALNLWTGYLNGLGFRFNFHPLTYTILTIAVALLFVYMVWKLPNVAQGMVGWGWSDLTFGEGFLGGAAATVTNAGQSAAGGAASVLAKDTAQSANAAASKVQSMIMGQQGP